MLRDVLSKASDAIRGTTAPSTTPGFLRPIDTGRIARELALETRGAERGRGNLPPTNSLSQDSVEREITQRIESEWSWQGGELINNLRAYAQRLVGYSIQSEFTKLQIVARDTIAQLQEAHHRAEAELGPLRERYIGHRDALRDFRARHKRKYIARTPPRRWTTLGLLSILIAVESILNGFFFAKGSQFGLMGGIGIAIGISLFNVIFSFALGLWPARWINLRNWIAKGLAFVVVLAGLAVILGLHGFAAHYRDAVAAIGESRAMSIAIAALLSEPWKLGDINSYYLFGLGLLFSISALYKGYTFDDPYPSYGARSRSADDARNAYSDEHADLFDHLAEIKDETIQRLNDGITQLPLFPQQAAHIRAQRAALVQTFRGYESSVESAGNQMLSLYRDSNRRNRASECPKYFERVWSLPHSFLDSAEVRVLTAVSDEPPVDLNEALVTLRNLAQEVIQRYEALLVAYPHPTKMETANGSLPAQALG